jgi:DNA-binding NarL/FixJ family response regulator
MESMSWIQLTGHLEHFLSVLCLPASVAAGTVCVLWHARSGHPLFRSATLLFLCVAGAELLAYARGVPSRDDKVGLELLAQFWKRNPAGYVELAIESLIQAPFLVLMTLVLCQTSQSEWQGLRRRAPEFVAGIYLVICLAGFLIMPFAGTLPPVVVDVASFGVNWIIRPLFLAVLGSAIIEAMIRIPDCPWPAIRQLLSRSWPALVVLTLLSGLGLFIPEARVGFDLLILFFSVATLMVGTRGMRPSSLGEKSSPVSDVDPANGMLRMGFTPREQEVCLHLLEGWTYGDIARFLNIAPTTVKTHVQNAYRKAGAANKLELARFLRTLPQNRTE